MRGCGNFIKSNVVRHLMIRLRIYPNSTLLIYYPLWIKLHNFVLVTLPKMPHIVEIVRVKLIFSLHIF